jgi:hypothetical protein
MEMLGLATSWFPVKLTLGGRWMMRFSRPMWSQKSCLWTPLQPLQPQLVSPTVKSDPALPAEPMLRNEVQRWPTPKERRRRPREGWKESQWKNHRKQLRRMAAIYLLKIHIKLAYIMQKLYKQIRLVEKNYLQKNLNPTINQLLKVMDIPWIDRDCLPFCL